MTATGHALVGAFIAVKVSNPAVAIPLAIISHIASDLLPHWDIATNREKKSPTRFFLEAAADVLLSFILVLLFIAFFVKSVSLSYVFLIVIFSQSLDYISAPYLFLGLKRPPFNWAYLFQKRIENKLDKPWGIVTQAAFVLVLFIAAYPF